MSKSERADLVVIGAGTVGGWAAYFAKAGGARKVVVLERDLIGQGASSRASGMVRAQGGTPVTVRLGQWSIDFYKRQQALLGTDSGFRELGYIILAVNEKDERAGKARVAMQQEAGLDVRWLSAKEAIRLNPTLATRGHRGGSYAPHDGCIDAPRNVRAYALAMQQAGVEVCERTPCLGLRTVTAKGGSVRVTVETPDGPIATDCVIVTGGPTLRDLGKRMGVRIPVGGARHQVAVTEPHEAFQVERQPMVFDVAAGLYWRLEEGGLLFGMSNPDEEPGPARAIDWPYLKQMRHRLHRLVPATRGLGLRKVWGATIDYTADHLPILGPALRPDGSVIAGVIVASPGGHGMMWGPAVARAAADLALQGKTDVVDVTDLGLNRFDAEGRSRFVEPVALPFPRMLKPA
jgi:sarcosine oxidase subunit beta